MNFGGVNIQSTTVTFSQNPGLSLPWKFCKVLMLSGGKALGTYFLIPSPPQTHTHRHMVPEVSDMSGVAWNMLYRHSPFFIPPTSTHPLHDQTKGFFVQVPDWVAILLYMSTLIVKFRTIHWNVTVGEPSLGKMLPSPLMVKDSSYFLIMKHEFVTASHQRTGISE